MDAGQAERLASYSFLARHFSALAFPPRIWYNTGMKVKCVVLMLACAGTLLGARAKDETYCIIDLSAGPKATVYPVTYVKEAPRDGWGADVYKTSKLVLKRVEPGTFIAGEDQTNEAHRVKITKPYYLGIYEVTQKQWVLVMGTNPSEHRGDMKPVENVSHGSVRGHDTGSGWPKSAAVDTDSFLGRLRARTQVEGFDLPTEAQWEYACRAGTTNYFSYGENADAAYMWTDQGMAGEQVVGTKKPNSWGFYDMHGNVWEWCTDWDSGEPSYGTDPKGPDSAAFRVFRGGSWFMSADDCYSARRGSFYSAGITAYYGFRLALN